MSRKILMGTLQCLTYCMLVKDTSATSTIFCICLFQYCLTAKLTTAESMSRDGVAFSSWRKNQHEYVLYPLNPSSNKHLWTVHHMPRYRYRERDKTGSVLNEAPRPPQTHLVGARKGEEKRAK